MRFKRGFTLIEVVISFSFIGLVIAMITYINIQTTKHKSNLIHYYAITQAANVVEIIKSDYDFFSHMEDYYDSNLYVVTNANAYKMIYFYFDHNNNQCEKDLARFFVKIQYNFTNSTKYTLNQYEVSKYDINQETSYQSIIGSSVKLSCYQKK